MDQYRRGAIDRGGALTVHVNRDRRTLREGGFAVVVVLGILAIIATIMLASVLETASRKRGIEVGFWFEDNVGFSEGREFPPLNTREIGRIRMIARAEIDHAFEGVRVAVSESHTASYRVRVLNQFRTRPGPPDPLGESRPLGPLGGEGAVCFQGVAARALHYARPHTDRATIVDAIGRGLGRTAVHEMAHLILFPGMRPSVDSGSYENETDSYEHYYGTVHWASSRPLLLSRFGR